MVLEESSIVQWALAKGEAKGEEKWRHAEAVEILLRQGTIKFGQPSSEIVDRIKSVVELNKLEEMAERLIRGNSWEELLP